MKLRRIDLYHEEFLAAVVGEMTPAELGVYWMICLLQYNRGGELLKYDMPWLRAKFRPGHGNRWVEDAVKRLIESGRLVVEGSLFGCSRVVVETLRARCRVVEASLNGHRGGRPRKDINGVEKGSGFSDEKLTTTTTTTTTKESDSLRESSSKRDSRASMAFAWFWEKYPRKVGKLAAERAFARAIKLTDRETILAAVDRYIADKPPDIDFCHPTTWLNQGRWNDELQSSYNGHNVLCPIPRAEIEDIKKRLVIVDLSGEVVKP